MTSESIRVRLVEINKRLGIYRCGSGGYIVDPRTTMFINDEVQAIWDAGIVSGEFSSESSTETSYIRAV